MTKRPVPPIAIHRPLGYGPLHQHLKPGCVVVLDPSNNLSMRGRKGKTFLFLFEIENMPGHGAFADGSGKVWWGLHLDNFRMATREEV